MHIKYLACCWALFGASMAAFGATASASAQELGQDNAEIVVRGEMEKIEKQVEALALAITRRPRIDKPIARRYGGICVAVHGMSAQFAHVLIDRIEENARQLDIHVQGEGCKVNTLVAFTRDSRIEIERLRQAEPWLFSSLLDHEYKRILRGNGAAQSWQATEVKGADGKEFATIRIGGRDVQQNTQPFTSNIAQQLRVDVEGAIVVFDNAFVPGKSIQQLADYATMRLFAPTDDMSESDGGSMETILSLFAPDAIAPDGLTAFDRAYLGALYMLPPTASGEAVREATWAAYRRARYEPALGASAD